MDVPTINFSTFISYVIVLITIVYCLFSFVVTRQVDLMNKSFTTPLAGIFKIIALIHFLASIFVAVLAIVLL